MNTIVASEILPDRELVAASRTGDRAAFGKLVERNKALVAAIAYAALGDLHASEDIAQQTFLIAWRDLGRLQDVEKIQPWLAGIARNLAMNHVRRRARDPLSASETIEPEQHTDGARSPAGEAISVEEQRILWETLAALPIDYREPLVLFYREQESVEHVAVALGISEDAVKQRLSRGRHLLQQRLAGRLERALRCTGPGAAFTLAVVAALPAAPTTVSAATVTAVAPAVVAAGATAAATGALLGWVGGAVGFACGGLGAFLGARAALASAQSAREHAYLVRHIWIGLWVVGYAIGMTVLTFHLGALIARWGAPLVVSGYVACQLAYVVALLGWITTMNRGIRAIRAEEGK